MAVRRRFERREVDPEKLANDMQIATILFFALGIMFVLLMGFPLTEADRLYGHGAFGEWHIMELNEGWHFQIRLIPMGGGNMRLSANLFLEQRLTP